MLKALVRQRRVPNPFGIIKNALHYNVHQFLTDRPLWPRALCLYVTYRCNMRCRMCGIWKLNDDYRGTELSLKEFDTILSNRLFSNLQMVNINGGEPNLRADLTDITAMLIERLPRLQAISLNSNGIPPRKTTENVAQMATLCRRHTTRFSVSISLHMIGDGFDQIAGIKNAFEKVRETFYSLKAVNRNNTFFLSANCVITKLNLHHLAKLIEWGRCEGIPVNFVLGEVRDRFGNLEMADEILVHNSDRAYLIAFLRELATSRRTFRQHSLRYHHLADMIEHGKARDLACHYFMGGAILGSDGRLYYCKHSASIGNCKERPADEIYFARDNLHYRKEVLGNGLCRTCPPNTYNRMEIEKDLVKVVLFSCFGRTSR